MFLHLIAKKLLTLFKFASIALNIAETSENLIKDTYPNIHIGQEGPEGRNKILFMPINAALCKKKSKCYSPGEIFIEQSASHIQEMNMVH